MDGLWKEYDSLAAKGYTGEGFLGSGRRVGEGISHDSGLSIREAREKALKTFEEKEKMRKLLGTGGKLGGKAVETKGRRMGDILADVSLLRLIRILPATKPGRLLTSDLFKCRLPNVD